ncbi:hypothetical protein [uncultured Arcobacter sp.]|uniref:hypothetical protein n=1 Tax=uncultured Arcobacter sp. TaxID=165434 RepID=UPI00261C6123|nr:hypothetical protein [uncultured Arcobacter sp.]
MQDFIDSYKVTFGINVEVEVKLDTSLAEGDIKITEKGYKVNASKDADALEILGKIKLHTIVNDPRVFKPTTNFMGIIVFAYIYSTMAKHLETLEMDLLIEKFLIKKEDSPHASYAVLKILGADPTLTGADSSLIDHYLTLELNSEVLNQIEEIKEENI